MSQETRAPLESINLKNSAGKVPNVVVANRAPSTGEKNVAAGDLWCDQSADGVYMLTSVSGGSQTWTVLS